MTSPDEKPEACRERLQQLANGFRVSQCIHATVELGLADRLHGGPLTCGALAEQAAVDPSALRRLLRVLVRLGLVQEAGADSFTLTPMGQLLCGGVEGSLRAELRSLLHPSSWAAWGELRSSVETGRPAFPKVFGQSAWAYRAAHPDAGRVFDEMARQCSVRDSALILRHLDLAGVRCVVDVGGGNGALLAAILASRPGLQGILLDQPSVVADAGRVMKEVGVEERCRIVGGDFFEEVPGGGDLYVLKAVLHDWDDRGAERVLQACRRAMTPEARIVVVEPVLEAGCSLGQAFMDLHMLVIHGGRERSAAEFDALLQASGFRRDRVERTDRGPALIYGKPV